MVREMERKIATRPRVRVSHVKCVRHEALSGSPTRHVLEHEISWYGLRVFFPFYFKNSLHVFYFLRQGDGKAAN